LARKAARPDIALSDKGPAWTHRLVGHEAAEQAFLQTLATGRIPHAWMIVGPKGVGKATLAYRIARRLLAPDAGKNMVPGGLFGESSSRPDTLDVEPSSPAFLRVARQIHPDFRVLERRTNPKTGKLRDEIVVEDVREVIDFIRMKPALGGRRVVIVDAADDLNHNAANALLKILEEPPSQSVLVLVAHAPRALLPTLVSRCRRVTLRPLSEALVAEGMALRLPGLDEKERRLAAMLAEGSMGRAIRVAEEGGGELFVEIAALLADWPNYEPQRLHGLADKMVGRAGSSVFDLAYEILEWWFGRFVRLASRNQRPEQDAFSGESALFDRMTDRASPQRWLELWQNADQVFDRVRRVNMDRKQAWIVACLILQNQGE
jgi:DNA polymerase-3 subunit delta'